MRLLAPTEDPRVVDLGLPSKPVRADPAQPPPLAADLFAHSLS